MLRVGDWVAGFSLRGLLMGGEIVREEENVYVVFDHIEMKEMRAFKRDLRPTSRAEVRQRKRRREEKKQDVRPAMLRQIQIQIEK